MLSFGICFCPGCHAANSVENRFCSKCGHRLQEKCKGCSQYVNINDRYCFECGVLIRKEPEIKIQKNRVEKFAQLRYIKVVFLKIYSSLNSFFKSKKIKSHKSKKHKTSK